MDYYIYHLGIKYHSLIHQGIQSKHMQPMRVEYLYSEKQIKQHRHISRNFNGKKTQRRQKSITT